MKQILDTLDYLVRHDSSTIDGANILLDNIIDNFIDKNAYSIKKFSFNGFDSVYISINCNFTPKLLLIGHLDTVGPEGWQDYEPFQMTVTNGKAIGLGMLDMKAGVAVMLHSARVNLNPDVAYLFVTDEEKGGFNCSGNISRLTEPTIIPEFAISPEPSNLQVEICSKGSFYVKVISKGLSAHSSRPDKGTNAIAQLNSYLTLVENLDFFKVKNKLLGKNTVCQTTLHCPDNGINKIPDYCECVLNFRYIPEISYKQIMVSLRQVAKKFNTNNNVGIFLQTEGIITGVDANLHGLPVSCDPKNNYVLNLSKIIKKYLGSVEYIGNCGASDIRFFSKKGVPAICFGPDGDDIHAPNEWIDLEKYKIYQRILIDYISSI